VFYCLHRVVARAGVVQQRVGFMPREAEFGSREQRYKSTQSQSPSRRAAAAPRVIFSLIIEFNNAGARRSQSSPPPPLSRPADKSPGPAGVNEGSPRGQSLGGSVARMLSQEQIHDIFDFYANFGRSAVM
jgi:hypothetical protein